MVETFTKILAIDFGVRRLGLALSDEQQTIALPFGIITVDGHDTALKRIKRVIDGEMIAHVIVGLPLNMDGTENDMCQQVRKFAVALGEMACVPIEFYDERLTSVSAERAMLEGDLSRRKRRKRQDSIAATILLQGYLDMIKSSRSGNGE